MNKNKINASHCCHFVVYLVLYTPGIVQQEAGREQKFDMTPNFQSKILLIP